MVINFGAGPAKLPEDVLREVQKSLVHYEDSQLSVMEMSHRASTYAKIHEQTIKSVRELL